MKKSGLFLIVLIIAGAAQQTIDCLSFMSAQLYLSR